MPHDLIATAQALGQASGGCEPLPNRYREIGLAAVANGLNLQLNTLDPDMAEAVARGTAALFPAWYWARSDPWGRRKASHMASKAR
jgi:hypothetical protein